MRTWEVSSVLARRKMNARTLPNRHPQVSRISIRRNWLVEPPTCRTPAKPVSLLTAQAALLGALPVPLCVDACGCDGDSGDSTNWMRSKRKLAVWPSTPWQAEGEVWPTKQPLLTSAAYPQAGRLPVSIIFSIGRTFASDFEARDPDCIRGMIPARTFCQLRYVWDRIAFCGARLARRTVTTSVSCSLVAQRQRMDAVGF